MSEILPNLGEHKLEPIETEPEKQHKPEHQQEKHEKQPDIKEIQKSIEASAISGKEVTVGERERPPQPTTDRNQLKAHAFNRSLQKIRSHLRPVDRSFSRFIHQPLVESVSEASAKSIARPSGILGGGIVAAIGGATILYISKRYGFSYNHFMFLALLLVGFAVGLGIELAGKVTRRK